MTKYSSKQLEARKGSVTVKIYAINPGEPNEQFTVVWHDGSERKRKTYRKLVDAQAKAKEMANRIHRGEQDAIELTGAERDNYLKAKQQLNGVSLSEAIDFYLANSAAICKPKSVQEVVDELVECKVAKGKSHAYLKDLRGRLRRFATAFQCPLASVSSQMIEQFLENMKGGGRTRNNYRRLIGTLFEFGKKKRYVPKTHPGTAEVDTFEEVVSEVSVFTPDELNKLLEHCEHDMLPYLVIAAFTGIRNAEICRLDWSEINLDEGFIEVKADKAKLRVRRVVSPLPEVLKQWLSLFAKNSGPVTPFENMAKQLVWLGDHCGVQWKQNALRHSSISYRLALGEDIHKVAQLSGNSPKMIQQHYWKVATAKQANEWFGLMPPKTLSERKVSKPHHRKNRKPKSAN
jgi:integrase